MAKMNTSHRYIYDAAPATLFRARTADAMTATANTNEVVLDNLKGYWNEDGELADETMAVIVNVTEIDATTGDESYSFAVKATDGEGNVLADVTLGSIKVSKPGQYVVLIDAATVKLADEDFNGLIITPTLGGTTPSVTFHAWMSQIKAA